jgi:hypothetical protein
MGRDATVQLPLCLLMAFLCLPLFTSIHTRNLLPNTPIEVLGPGTAEDYTAITDP